MKKIIAGAFDFTLIACVFSKLYILRFGYLRNIPAWSSPWHDIHLILTVIAVFILPFRVKQYPTLGHFITYDRAGKKRTTIIVPAFWLVLIIYASLIAARIFVKIFESAYAN